MSTENDSTYIKVPKSVVQIGAIAILFVIIDLISELIGFFQEPETRIDRIYTLNKHNRLVVYRIYHR